MIDTRKFVPDGIAMHDARGTRLVVFNPPWWRLDRWLFWAWVRLFSRVRRHGTAEFTALSDGAVVTFELRVYEDA